MLDQSIDARLSRAGLRFRWDYETALCARRSIIEEVPAALIATELRFPNPQRVYNIVCQCRRDLLTLAETECGPDPDLTVVDIPFDPETMSPENDAENARLLFDCLRQGKRGRPMSGPEPTEGDRDRVSARIMTYELCLEAVKAVRRQAETPASWQRAEKKVC